MSAPLVFDPDADIARDEAGAISRRRFLESASSLAARFSSSGAIVNLCENRYHFLIAFAAATSRAKTTLLPPSHAAAALSELVSAYPDCETLDDPSVAAVRPGASADLESTPPDFIAAIGHTSGSTGKPASHAKSWADLCVTTALNAKAIRGAIGSNAVARQPWIVATVPPQHMYGLELSVLLPLIEGFGIHSGKPLLPADVAAALEQVPAPRVLVSTPVHLRVLVESGVAFPDVAVVVSATAPLTKDAAERLELRFGGALVEMFGSTETCVIATRRTASEECWRPYPGILLEPASGGTRVRAPWLARPQLLQDIIRLRDDGAFTVIGRHTDLVEVAGKRVSLADLTRRIASLPGVLDVHVFQPEARDRAGVARCAALVVAPGHSAQEILGRLRPGVDAVFLPRPLVVVPELPRNEVGKLSIESAKALLTAASRPRREK